MSAPRGNSDTTRDPLLKRWSRRAVTIPGILILGASFIALLPVLLVVTTTLDVARPGLGAASRTRAVLLFALYFGCELWGVATALVLGIVLLGGRIGGQERYVAAHAALQRAWVGALFHGSARIFGMRYDVLGAELVARGPVLLFVRHTSIADTLLTAALVANPFRQLLLYVVKRELLWDPCLDLVGLRLPNAFVARTGKRAEAEIRAVAGLAEQLAPDRGVLIYPEGTRFSERKRQQVIETARARGHEELAQRAESLRHVLPPKLGGPLALLDAAPGVDVAFVAHTGFEGAATFASLWHGSLVGKTIRVRITRVAAGTIPAEGRDAWLFQRWAELDAWVGAHLEADVRTTDGGSQAEPQP